MCEVPPDYLPLVVPGVGMLWGFINTEVSPIFKSNTGIVIWHSIHLTVSLIIIPTASTVVGHTYRGIKAEPDYSPLRFKDSKCLPILVDLSKTTVRRENQETGKGLVFDEYCDNVLGNLYPQDWICEPVNNPTCILQDDFDFQGLCNTDGFIAERALRGTTMILS